MPQDRLKLVDEDGRSVGEAPRGICHGNPSLTHQVVHVLVLNSESRIYLQKRSKSKDIQPGKWDTSVGGHVLPGEAPSLAAEREMAEELGIRREPIEFLHSYIMHGVVEREQVTTYMCVYNGEIRPDPEEIEKGRFWSIGEIEENLRRGVFTPNFEEEFDRFAAARGLKRRANPAVIGDQ